MAENRVDAIEIARTVDRVTDDISHLRRVGAGATLCGISIKPSELQGDGQIWWSVADDEANRFADCMMCERFAASYRIVSRPAQSIRPETQAPPALITSVGNVAGLYGSIGAAVSEFMAGKSIVDHSITADVYRLAWAISFATGGDGITGNMSAIDANKALRVIDGHASAIRYDLDPYVPESVKKQHEEAPSVAQAGTRHRDYQIGRLALEIVEIAKSRIDEITCARIARRARLIAAFVNGERPPEIDETAPNT